ncbi:hypothetical protein LCGC14_2030940 [marine sediment metagenome]|uniref:Uncharacterized protein n=1 Tax=marine sediment metagenome TaxID=412755 RepID=A0A0F9HRT3_9ZZZZ
MCKMKNKICVCGKVATQEVILSNKETIDMCKSCLLETWSSVFYFKDNKEEAYIQFVR